MATIKRYQRGKIVTESSLPEYKNEPVQAKNMRGVDVASRPTREKPVLIKPTDTNPTEVTAKRGEDVVTRVSVVPAHRKETQH